MFNKPNVLIQCRQQKIFLLEELKDWLSSSPATARRCLKAWNVLSSYNKNASYYTFSDIAKFNVDGIWRYKGIYFSKYGTLKQTIKHFVCTSSSGLSAQELEDILGIPVRNFLSQQKQGGLFHRERHNGVYIYYSNDEFHFHKQKISRQAVARSSKNLELPADSEAIVILVELIKHPDLTIEQLYQRLNKGISMMKIKNLLTKHNLLKKT